MKKRIIALFIILTICSPYISPIHAAPQGVGAFPTVDAHGAVLMDAETGRVLWGKAEHKPLAMASTTKIMTAILALESGRLEETVTVSRRAAAAPRVKMGLSLGEKLRLHDLLYALMLESSNDAAVAIAEFIHTTVEEFCAAMTEKARILGATDTVFETPNGLDAGEHHSTPYDLAIITRYALQVPGFSALVNTPSAQFSSDKRSYAMANRNRLLHEYSGANGVKTGFTTKAGHCFVGSAKRNVQGEDMQLIAVVLASGWGAKGRNQKYADSKEILSYGFANYIYEEILKLNETAGTLPVTRSRTDTVDYVYTKDLRIPLTPQEKTETRIEIHVPNQMKAPIKPGDTMGTARIYIGETIYTEIPLTAVTEAARHDLKTSLEKVLNTFAGLISKTDADIVLPEFERE
jgi:D-alanyl-D-alanine carboxypeptidase (penicillin-binding protein 5/6)